MIKTIGQGLPRYRQLQSSCERHFQNAQDEQLVLLSYMYADMVQFCLGLYGMFSRGALNLRTKNPLSLRSCVTSIRSPDTWFPIRQCM